MITFVLIVVGGVVTGGHLPGWAFVASIILDLISVWVVDSVHRRKW